MIAHLGFCFCFCLSVVHCALSIVHCALWAVGCEGCALQKWRPLWSRPVEARERKSRAN